MATCEHRDHYRFFLLIALYSPLEGWHEVTGWPAPFFSHRVHHRGYRVDRRRQVSSDEAPYRGVMPPIGSDRLPRGVRDPVSGVYETY